MDQKLSCMITLITYIIRYTKSRLPFISSLYHHFYGFEDYFSQPRHQAVMTRASASGPTISGVKSIFRCSASGNEENKWERIN